MLFQLRTTSIFFSSCTNKHLKGSVPDTWTYHYIHDMTESLKIRSTYPLGFYFPFWYAFSSKLRFSLSLLLMTFKQKIPWNTRNKFVERIYQYGFFLNLYRFCLLWSCSPPRSSNISLLGSLLPRSLNIKNVFFLVQKCCLKSQILKYFIKITLLQL